ncbi:glycine receptor subunit alpha-3-like [Nematostella vectensis]|uniref:glycine receptor subunit alpha-3-like n=1 Tax=Nematostella vectensis TaxID=45351 RepID=UPI0020772800|nr:glycine receptor subunit alpha-3-like [Nematostella vectensis]XP_048584384.1 glycine receptor subunit alpha-3-like [Nematostella vectensis]
MALLKQLAGFVFVILSIIAQIASKKSVVKESSQMDRSEIINATRLQERMLSSSNYDRKARPNAGKEPLDVYLSIGVQAFTSIKETNMEFTTSLFLRQEWTDIRLAHGLDGTISLGGVEVNQIWRPDTYINNNNDYELHVENQLALISKYGDVYFSARMLVRASCQMYLQNFPMDVQKCSLVFESFAYTNDHVAFHWKGRNPITIFNKELSEFDMEQWLIEEVDMTYVAGKYRNLKVTFIFRRRLGFYLINFYVPCVVMVIMSWIVFWMDSSSIGERISLGITTILTIVFLLGSSNSTMPRVSYPKMIDWYLMGSFLFVFTTLIMCLLIYLLDKRTKKVRKDRPLEAKTQTYTVTNSAVTAPTATEEAEARARISYYIADAQGAVYPIMRNRTQTSIPNKRASMILSPHFARSFCGLPNLTHKNLGVVCNQVCRALFPMAFLIFNAVYWAALAS